MSEPIISKVCTECNEIKPLSGFSKRSNRPCGYASSCKICRHKYQKKHRQTEHGKAMHNAGNRRYNKSEKGKATSHRHYIRYPQKMRAKDTVGKAVKAGKLPRPNTLQCSCGKQAEQYHHHLGYAKKHRLDVIPVCRKCHNKMHLIA